MLVAGGATSVTTYFALRLTADGTAATGLTITNIDLQYVRSGVAPVAKVDATALAATDSAWDDNKAIEIDATDQPGLYRVDWPNAAFAAGVREVILSVKVATAFTEHLRVEIDGEVNVVEWAGTDVVAGAIPAAAADAAGGLPISDAGGLDLDSLIDALVLTSATIETVTSQTVFVLPATADAVDDDAYNGAVAVFIDGTDPNQKSIRLVTDYDAGTRKVTVSAAPDFTITTSDTLTILASATAAQVWDRILTGNTHNIATSAGRRLRQIEAAFVLHSGTAQDGGDNTITLDTGASSIDDFYNHARVVITEGTGIEQERIIVDYVGSTRVATIAPPWVTNPVNGSVFEVEPALSHAETNSRTAHVGFAQAGAAGSVTLAADASATTDFYEDDVAIIDSGTGAGQARIIIAYNGTTKVATIEPDWATNPDTTSEIIVEEALGVADVIAVSHDETAADTLELFVEALDQSTGQLDSGSFAADAINAAALAADAVNEIADGVLDEDYEDTTTLRQFLRVAAGVLFGKLSGAATTTVTIRNEADDGNRVVATVDADGNRSAITLTKS